jgi:hypothetical protein
MTSAIGIILHIPIIFSVSHLVQKIKSPTATITIQLERISIHDILLHRQMYTPGPLKLGKKEEADVTTSSC